MTESARATVDMVFEGCQGQRPMSQGHMEFQLEKLTPEERLWARRALRQMLVDWFESEPDATKNLNPWAVRYLRFRVMIDRVRGFRLEESTD